MSIFAKNKVSHLAFILLAMTAFALVALLPQSAFAADMYRLYNPNSGEHFYTADSNERNDLYIKGWEYEGIGWVAPDAGEPVYRLYNPNAGDHHYTPSAAERQMLIDAGWNDEGIGWKTGGAVPLYRQYNPNAVAGSHNFTTNKGEDENLAAQGWKQEGIGWYGEGVGRADDSIPEDVKKKRDQANRPDWVKYTESQPTDNTNDNREYPSCCENPYYEKVIVDSEGHSVWECRNCGTVKWMPYAQKPQWLKDYLGLD